MPAPGDVAVTVEIRIVDADERPVEGATVHYLGDIDWRKPTPEQVEGLKRHGSDQEHLVKHLGNPIPITGSVCFVPVPKDWGIVTARKAGLYGELNLTPGLIGRSILRMSTTQKLWIELIDRDGRAVPGKSLRLAIRLSGNRSVIYPIGETNDLGRLDLTHLHRKLRRYRSDGESIDGLSILASSDEGDRTLQMLDPNDLPKGLLKVRMR